MSQIKNLMIDVMNDEKNIYENVKSLFAPYMSNEKAEAKTNEVMRITGKTYGELSADDMCPYCTELRNEDGICQGGNVR
jgi:predicted HAD superfamily hydrolase